jgi:PEGA domain
VVVAVVATAGACALGRGLLKIACTAPGAVVYVDDRPWGSARDLGERGLEVSEGRHRLEIRADGYFSVTRDLVVARGERLDLRIELRAIPPGVSGW